MTDLYDERINAMKVQERGAWYAVLARGDLARTRNVGRLAAYYERLYEKCLAMKKSG